MNDKTITIFGTAKVKPGGTGTLLELAKVWELKNKGFIKEDKTIILVGGFWKPLVDSVASDNPKSIRCVRQADGPGQVIGLINNY